MAQDLDTGEWVAIKRQKPFQEDFMIEVDGRYYALRRFNDKKLYDERLTEFKAFDLEKRVHVQLHLTQPYPQPKFQFTAQQEAEQLDKADLAIKDNNQHLIAFQRFSPSKGQEQFYCMLKLGKGFESLNLSDPTYKMSTIFWLKLGKNILTAIQHLRDKNILHRDIKPENIMFDRATGEIMLVDHGFAKQMTNGQINEKYFRLGSEPYVAPEVIKGTQDIIYSEKTEVYSLGVTLGNLYHLMQFKEEKEEGKKAKCVIEKMQENSDWFNKNTRITDVPIRKRVLQLINAMVSLNPLERPQLNDLIYAFETFIQQCNKEAKIGLLNVNDYMLAQNNKVIKDRLINNLTDFDRVFLIDPHQENKSSLIYTKTKHELDQEDIAVRDILYAGQPVSELVNEVINDVRKSEPDLIPQFYDINMDGSLNSINVNSENVKNVNEKPRNEKSILKLINEALMVNFKNRPEKLAKSSGKLAIDTLDSPKVTFNLNHEGKSNNVKKEGEPSQGVSSYIKKGLHKMGFFPAKTTPSKSRKNSSFFKPKQKTCSSTKTCTSMALSF